MAENIDVHLYNFFSTRRYTAPTASVKLRTSSPKMDQDEDCVHQKSHRK